jgi:protein involved in polysaccharide export with SLBB domain
MALASLGIHPSMGAHADPLAGAVSGPSATSTSSEPTASGITVDGDTHPPRLPPGVKYHIVANDQIAISVRNHPDLSLREAVRSDGKIGYPVLGDIQVAGLTIEQVREKVARGLAAYLRNPDVTAVIELYHHDSVFVVGDVRANGAYPFDKGMTALEAIALAGGPDDRADLQHVHLERNHHIIATLDLTDNSGPAVTLQPGDMLVLPVREAATITVVGAVSRPGTQPLLAHERILDALTAAVSTPVAAPVPTGASPAATPPLPQATAVEWQDADLGHVSLHRGADVHVLDARAILDGSATDNIPLEPGDFIYVPPAERITVVGAVQKQGTQSLAPNEHILDAITSAGLISDAAAGTTLTAASKDQQPTAADLAHVTLTRDGQTQTIDVARILKGTMDQNILLHPGDIIVVPADNGAETILGEVQKPQTVHMASGSRVLDLVNLAGGLTPRADTLHATLKRVDGSVTTINLDKLLAGSDPTQNLEIKDGDLITVPVTQLQIAVLGQVARPGVYEFKPGDDILQALLAAGSTTAEASLSNVKLIHFDQSGHPAPTDINVDKMVKTANFDGDRRLQPHDIVYVPTKGHAASPWTSILPLVGYLPYLRGL